MTKNPNWFDRIIAITEWGKWVSRKKSIWFYVGLKCFLIAAAMIDVRLLFVLVGIGCVMQSLSASNPPSE